MWISLHTLRCARIQLPKSVSALSQLNTKQQSPPISEANINFVPVYKLPMITTLARLSRMKLYQTYATVIGIPLTTILSQLNMIPADIAIATTAVGMYIYIHDHTLIL